MVRNVVLLCLDTVRYDYFTRHAANLQEMADISVEECRTASTWSVPSHASMFTGDLPYEHGFHSATPKFNTLREENTFLADLDGFQYVGVSANPYASPVFGFDQLFDDFYHIESSMPFVEGMSPSKFWHECEEEGWNRYSEFLRACVRHDRPLRSLLNGATSQLEKLFAKLSVAKPFDDGCERILSRIQRVLSESEAPTFVFGNVMDVHGPLTNVRSFDQSLIAEEHRGRSPDINALEMNMDQSFDDHESDIAVYRDLYAAAVEYTGRKVEQFCREIDDDTAVIITADHGEQLDDTSDQRRFGHVTPDMTEQLLHVPLLLFNTDISVDESEHISHLDLGNLITSIAIETDFESRAPLVAEVAGLGVAHPPTEHDDFEYWNRVSRCAYIDGGRSKYVWDSFGSVCQYERQGTEYVLQSEGGPDLVPPKATSPFSVDVGEVKRSQKRKDGISDSVESQLEELGYL